MHAPQERGRPIKPPAKREYWPRSELVTKADSFHKASWSSMTWACVCLQTWGTHCHLHENLRAAYGDCSAERAHLLIKSGENGHLSSALFSILLIKIQRRSSADIGHQSGLHSITTELAICNLISPSLLSPTQEEWLSSWAVCRFTLSHTGHYREERSRSSAKATKIP